MIPPLAVESALDVGWILAGLGAFAAGLGILKAGIELGRFAETAKQTVRTFAQHLERIETIQVRTAAAAECVASMAETSRDIGKSVQALAQMLGDDHKVLFASMRGVQYEMTEIKEKYGPQTKTAD